MSDWPSTRARAVLAALERLGWPDVVFAFHDRDEIGAIVHLDELATRDAVRAGPGLHASAAARPACFDEYQKAAAVLSAIEGKLSATTDKV